jgi:hypothetical protein
MHLPFTMNQKGGNSFSLLNEKQILNKKKIINSVKHFLGFKNKNNSNKITYIKASQSKSLSNPNPKKTSKKTSKRKTLKKVSKKKIVKK